MFEISNQWLLFVVDVSAKSLVLAIAAAITMRLFRLRDSNLRHRIWSGVLAAMLALPVLSSALPAIQVSVPGGLGELARTEPAAAHDDVGAPTTNPITPAEPVFSARNSETATVPTTASTEPARRPTLEAAEALVSSPAPSSDVGSRELDLRRSTPPVLLGLWFAVTAFLLARLSLGLWSSARITRRGRVVSDEVATLSGTRGSGIAFRETNETCVPVTVGLFKPTVLLPPNWRTWTYEKLHAIIAHESGHVARRDFLVTLAAELNRCLYWFHPVSWWLRKRLSDLAEEVCDDAAVKQSDNPVAYARYLLEVATEVGRSNGRVVQPGLAMARESNVESRITTILDFKRPLSQRVTWKTAMVMAVFGLPLIAATAAVSPATDSQSGSKASSPGVAADMVRVHGQVTDADGKPVAHAQVSVWRVRRPNWYAADNISTKVGDLKVDAEGRFDRSFPKSKLPDSEKTQGGQWSVLVAKAKDHAVAAMRGTSETGIQDKKVKVQNFLRERVTLKLTPAVPIQGRLVSLEGQPVAGAKVEIYRVDRPKPGAVAKWLKQADQKPNQSNGSSMSLLGAPETKQYFPSHDIDLPLGAIESVTTARDGSFNVTDLIGRDGLAVLRFTHPTIAYRLVHVIGRDMKSVYGHGVTILAGSVRYFGQNPTVIASPSVPVQGIVRDIDTKEPIANAWVAVGTVYGNTWSQSGLFRTRTDSEGKYRIEGLPLVPINRKDKGQLNQIEVRPGDAPYIETRFRVPVGNGMDPIEFNPELRKAVMARGQLLDKRTGEPIANARLYYAPYSKNENCGRYTRYADGTFTMLGNDSRYLSDKQGYFQLPVIPGRGVVGARIDKGSYVSAYGAKGIEAFAKDNNGRPNFLALSDSMIPSTYRSLLEVNVPKDAKNIEVTMEADPGLSLTVKFVDADGQPLAGVEGRGLTSDQRWKKVNGSEAEVTGLEIAGVRSFYVSHKKANLARMTQLILKEGQEEVTIQLLPYGQMAGCIVDPEGRPIVGAAIQASYTHDSGLSASLQQIKTDKDGCFSYSMPVGVKYNFQVRIGDQLRSLKDADLSEKPKQIDLGELIYDEYAERWAKLKPRATQKVLRLRDRRSRPCGLYAKLSIHESRATPMTMWQAYSPTKQQPWDECRVAHLHRRSVFGLTANELRRDLAATPEDAISRVLSGEGREGVPAEFDQLSRLIGDAAAGQQNVERLKAWWIYRLLLSPDPLGERLTFMWHNHFATSNLKVNNLPQMKAQNDTFRQHARAEFGTLLRAMLQDCALLRWLDAQTNRKGHANENLGRELMELFTLGVGNYTEDDVKNAARALTGLGVKNGEFRFDKRRHDEATKTILGTKRRFDAEQLADLLLSNPATSKRLADKLIAEFFAPDVVSDQARDDLAAQLRATNLNIGKATETVLRSELFFSEANINKRITDPLTFLIAPLRAFEVFSTPPSTLTLADWLRRMGLDLFYPPNVAGWPGGRTWLTTRTIIARANYGSAVVSGEVHRVAQPPELEAIAGKPGQFGSLLSKLLTGGTDNVSAETNHKAIALKLLTGTKVHLH